MDRILCIETSTEICSVSISENGCLVDSIIDNPLTNGNNIHGQHSKLLALIIRELLERNKIKQSSLSAVAISEGPGSYTGLRIGVSIAKGICFGLNIPLISIKTLKLIALMAKKNANKEYDLIIPMMDARRMEVYCVVYDNKLNEIQKTQAMVIDDNSFKQYENNIILFCGNGALKCKSLLTGLKADFDGVSYPSAEFMVDNASYCLENKHFANLVYFEPFYLKSFVATTPKKIL